MNSFHSGAIFDPSLGHKLSRNACVVSIAFPERISYWRKVSRYDLENRDFREKSNFAEGLAHFAKAVVVYAGLLDNVRASGRKERLYESFRAVNNG